MYEVLSSFKWKPIPKFQQQLIYFEKPQNFSKTPKPKFQNMKCMKNKILETYQEKKNLEKAWEITKEKVWSERERVFGRWTGVDRSREIEEMRIGSRRMNI